VKVLRTNNDMEFYPANFKSFCKKEGIIRYHTIPHTPQQNGGIESMKKQLFPKLVVCCPTRVCVENFGLRLLPLLII
jgi:transposase InsO family protein